MLRVTKMTDYASMLLACLAQAPGKVHSASDLAELARLELPTVSKVLKPLSRAGLIEAFRGSQGGYRLARPAAQITLFDVVEAMEGRLEMTGRVSRALALPGGASASIKSGCSFIGAPGSWTRPSSSRFVSRGPSASRSES